MSDDNIVKFRPRPTDSDVNPSVKLVETQQEANETIVHARMLVVEDAVSMVLPMITQTALAYNIDIGDKQIPVDDLLYLEQALTSLFCRAMKIDHELHHQLVFIEQEQEDELREKYMFYDEEEDFNDIG